MLQGCFKVRKNYRNSYRRQRGYKIPNAKIYSVLTQPWRAKKKPEKIRKIQKIRYSFHVDFVMIDEEIDEMKPYIVVQSRHLAQASTEKRCKDSQIEVD